MYKTSIKLLNLGTDGRAVCTFKDIYKDDYNYIRLKILLYASLAPCKVHKELRIIV